MQKAEGRRRKAKGRKQKAVCGKRRAEELTPAQVPCSYAGPATFGLLQMKTCSSPCDCSPQMTPGHSNFVGTRANRSLPSAYRLLLSAFRLLLIPTRRDSRKTLAAFCFLPSAFRSLPSAFCLPLSAFCFRPSAFRLLPSQGARKKERAFHRRAVEQLDAC